MMGRTTAAPPAQPSPPDPGYTFGAVAEILDMSESKLRYWSQTGFVGPSMRQHGKQLFSFADLVGVKAAKELTERGFKPGEIRKALEKVRGVLPHIDRPLERLRVAFDGESLAVVDGSAAYEPDGQRLLDFGIADLATRAAEVQSTPQTAAAVSAPADLSPAGAATANGEGEMAATPPPGAYDWFLEGIRLQAQALRAADAAACFGKALQADPGLAAAHTNLGHLAYQRGDVRGARAAFEAALALDPDQPEARFNLANLVLEAGDHELAVAEYRRVLQLAPDFADAHYNLAVALERLGGRAQARAHLQLFLGLHTDSSGSPWAAEARAFLARL